MNTQEPNTLPASRSPSPPLRVADASVDRDSLRRSSLWDSGRSSPAVLQDDPEALTNELLNYPRNPHDEDPVCRGKKGYTYPFKVKLEGATCSIQPAEYAHSLRAIPDERPGLIHRVRKALPS